MLSGMTRTSLYPLTAATMARPMPVLPEVGSTITPPGLSLPDASASTTIDSAMRSLIDAPGLTRSCLIHTSAFGPNRRLTRTCGVLPMVSRIVAAFIPGSPPVRWRANRPARTDLQGLDAAWDHGVLRRRLDGQLKGAGAAQLGKYDGPGQGHGNRSQSARHGREHRSEQGRHKSASSLPELVRSRNRQCRSRGDPPAHFIGSVELNERL